MIRGNVCSATRAARARIAPSGRRAAWLLCTALLALGCGSRQAPTGPPAVDASALQARVAAERGHPLLVVFWATWCQPCIEEMPDLVALHRESPEGLRVLAVSLDVFLSGPEARRIVTEYLGQHPLPLDHAIYSGNQDSLFSAFDMPGNIPYAILYAADGRVVKRFSGSVSLAEIRAALSSSRGPRRGAGE